MAQSQSHLAADTSCSSSAVTATPSYSRNFENFHTDLSKLLNKSNNLKSKMKPYLGRKHAKGIFLTVIKGCCPNENLHPVLAVCLLNGTGKTSRYVPSQSHTSSARVHVRLLWLNRTDLKNKKRRGGFENSFPFLQMFIPLLHEIQAIICKCEIFVQN